MNKKETIYFLDWLEKNTPFTKQMWLREMERNKTHERDDLLKDNITRVHRVVDMIWWDQSKEYLDTSCDYLEKLNENWGQFYDDNIKHYNIFFSREKIENFKIIPEINKTIQFEN